MLDVLAIGNSAATGGTPEAYRKAVRHSFDEHSKEYLCSDS
jgi:hypothetical protein